MCNGGDNRRQTGEVVYVESWSISNAQPRIQDVKSNRLWSPLPDQGPACILEWSLWGGWGWNVS